MATRSEMEAELYALKAKMAELDKLEKEATEEQAQPAPEPVTEPPDETAPRASLKEAKSEIQRLLEPYGLSEETLEELATEFWNELDALPQNKPLITAIGAFALGFVLGRMTK